MALYFSNIARPSADLPVGARPQPPSHRFYGAVLAIALVAVLSLVTIHGVRKGIGLEDTWLLVSLLCLLVLPNALAALAFASLRQAAKRVAAVSAVGLVVTFVGFGLARDANKARIAAEQRPAAAVVQGVALPGATGAEKEGPAAEGGE